MKITNSHQYMKYRTKNVVPAMRYDEVQDLLIWQQEARQKLNELLGIPFEHCEDEFTIEAKEVLENYTHIEFSFQSEQNYYVSCDMLIPVGITKPLPTAICLQGHSTGKHISIGVPKFKGDIETIAGGRDLAVRAVEEGFCAVVLEQRYMGTAGQDENGMPSCLTRNEAMASLLMGRCAVGERVWDIQRLIDVLEKYMTEYVDIERIICMGNSGGGTSAFYSSCLDERIYLSIPSCAVCTFEESIMAMKHCPCNFVPGIRKYFDMGDIGGLIAPRRLIVVCGIEDGIFPVHGVEESYRMIQNVYKYAGKEDLCYIIKGNGGHQFYPDDVWPVVKKMIGDI